MHEFGEFPCLAELVVKIRIYETDAEQVKARLDELVEYNKGWTDQCLAVLRKSGAPSPKTFTILYFVRDYEVASRWEPSQWKVDRTISVTV